MSSVGSSLRRRIAVQLAVVLLVLAALLAVLWAISMVRGVLIIRGARIQPADSWVYKTSRLGFGTSRGRIGLALISATVKIPPPDPLQQFDHASWDVESMPAQKLDIRGTGPAWLAMCGIDWQSDSRLVGTPALPRAEYMVVVPYWLLIVLALFIAWLFGRPNWIARRRVRDGLCPRCGYNVTATPWRCPECGLANEAVPVMRAADM
jgi:hypothetical protein